MEQDIYRRQSICLGCPKPDVITQEGEGNFCKTLQDLYVPAESKALEDIVNLKHQLRKTTDSNDFYATLSKGLTGTLNAQFLFVSKRIIHDADQPAIEMPPIGEPGSCLMALSWYFNDGHALEGTARDVSYHAYACPCAYMRHDKVFLVPDHLNDFVPNNPNSLPFPCESYLGIPLFYQSKCIAHFGLMWTAEGNANRKLGWGWIEMMCHTLEDLILQQVLRSTEAGKVQPEVTVVPHTAISHDQSLKTYARCLSHELRTPMHGVVGMLDIMYATVQEAVESNTNIADKQVFQTLKDNIELVQVSSRRAVEAADNVVQAYDLGMGQADNSTSDSEGYTPAISIDRPAASPLQGLKRRPSWATHDHPARHRLHTQQLSDDRQQGLATAVEEADRATRIRWSDDMAEQETPRWSNIPSSPAVSNIAFTSGQGLAYCNIRDLTEYVVKESLRIGKGFDSAVLKEVEGGQIIDVVSIINNQKRLKKTVEWTVDSSTPEIIWIDEKDLAKLVSCVFQNALKFTDEGRITLKVTTTLTHLVINITDTGPGIPESFIPNIFKPFSREDETITRQTEGLGLGLLVARGISRKLRGDLTLVRSNTDGPQRGVDFEIRLPCSEGSRSTSPESPIVFSALQSPYPNKALRPHPVAKMPSLMPKIPIMPQQQMMAPPQPSLTRKVSKVSDQTYTKNLASTHPLTFLVAEDNNISRKILVNMLTKLGYDSKSQIYEAADGSEAVKQVAAAIASPNPIELIVMDLWMPSMDGYEASERILGMYGQHRSQSASRRSFSEPDGLSMAKAGTLGQPPTIFAVTADATDGAANRATKAGMEGFMVKPFKIRDLEKLIRDGWARRNPSTNVGSGSATTWTMPVQMELAT